MSKNVEIIENYVFIRPFSTYWFEIRKIFYACTKKFCTIFYFMFALFAETTQHAVNQGCDRYSISVFGHFRNRIFVLLSLDGPVFVVRFLTQNPIKIEYFHWKFIQKGQFSFSGSVAKSCWLKILCYLN